MVTKYHEDTGRAAQLSTLRSPSSLRSGRGFPFLLRSSTQPWQQPRAACSDHQPLACCLLQRRLFSFSSSSSLFPFFICIAVKRASSLARCCHAKCSPVCSITSNRRWIGDDGQRRRTFTETRFWMQVLNGSCSPRYIYMKGARPDDTLQRHGS